MTFFDPPSTHWHSNQAQTMDLGSVGHAHLAASSGLWPPVVLQNEGLSFSIVPKVRAMLGADSLLLPARLAFTCPLFTR